MAKKELEQTAEYIEMMALQTGPKGDTGKGIASTSYSPATGIVTITFTDATTYQTGDIRGQIGLAGPTGKGIQSTAYNAGTGILTITFTDASTYQTTDIRGAKGDTGATGNGVQSASYNATNGILTITFTDTTTYQTGDLRGPIGLTGNTGNGITGTAYDAGTGIVTITFSDASTFQTTDIRGATGAKGDTGATGKGITGTAYNAGTGILTLTFSDASTFNTGDLRGADGAPGLDGTGAGDMAAATYDTNGDGKVNAADDSDKLGGAAAAEFAKLASPDFSGSPKVPTPAPGTNTTQAANTAFVLAALAALVNSSPAALDTLNELAIALGNDPNFATTMTNALAGKSATTHDHALTYEPKNANLQTHVGSTANPHGVTKSQVGLGNADNTSDANKPVSTAQQAALDLKAPLGSASAGEIWTALTGTYASIYTFTFAGTDKDAALVKKSIFTCTDSAGTTRRYGFVKTAVNASGTITVTVVTTTNLAAGDKDFKVAYNQKIYPFIHYVRIPGQVTYDASYSAGPWNLDLLEAMKFISSDAAAITAAAGSGASMTWNVYSGATALYGTAPDLGTSTALRDQRPTIIDVAESANLSLRIPSCGGATNYAADVQFRIYLIPTSLFSAF